MTQQIIGGKFIADYPDLPTGRIKPAVGYSLYTYESGTVTPAATFSDAELLASNTNPIILDARGEASIFLTPNVVYTLVLKSTTGATIWTRDGVVAALSPADLAVPGGAGQIGFSYAATYGANTTGKWLQDLALSGGSSFIGFNHGGIGAVTRSTQSKDRDTTCFFDYMSAAQIADCEAGSGLIDMYAACQAAIDAAVGTILMKRGLYPISQQLIIRNNCTGIIGESMYDSVFEKNFNGDLIASSPDGAIFKDFGIDGNGATRTGGGIRPEGYNTQISYLRINDTADACIIFPAAIGSNIGSATYSVVKNCFLNPTNITTTFGIRSDGDDDSIRPTCRTFTQLNGGSSLVDFSGMNYAVLSNSLGTNVKFSATSSKIHMINNRITTSETITILGADHAFDGNNWGFSIGKELILDSTCANVHYGSSNAISINGAFGKSPTLNTAIGAPQPNFINSELTAFTFTWLGSTTNPVLGNASTSAFYKLSGQLCYATLNLAVGNTTVAGTGTYTFQLPFEAFVTSVCPVLLKTPAGAFYQAIGIVQGGASVITIYISDAITTPFSSTSLSFGTNATMNLTMVYLVSPS